VEDILPFFKETRLFVVNPIHHDDKWVSAVIYADEFIKLPVGYRLVKAGEVIRGNDLMFSLDGWYTVGTYRLVGSRSYQSRAIITPE